MLRIVSIMMMMMLMAMPILFEIVDGGGVGAVDDNGTMRTMTQLMMYIRVLLFV